MSSVRFRSSPWNSAPGMGAEVLHQILGCHSRVDVCQGKTETRSYSKAFAEDGKSM